MTIIEQKPLHLAEVREFVKNLDEKKDLEAYLKKFSKLNKEKSDALAEEVRKLGDMKIKEEDIIKIVDFLPKDVEDINKIFTDVSLSEEEANAILEIIKKY
jgi:DNA-directed RNA polymerase subunit F